MPQNIDHQSKLRAYDLYDSGKIHSKRRLGLDPTEP